MASEYEQKQEEMALKVGEGKTQAVRMGEMLEEKLGQQIK